MKKQTTLAKQLKSHKDIDVPYHVWTCFSDKAKTISVAGDQASFGEDYKTIAELRRAIEFYVEQLDGTVKWSKE